MISLDIRPFEGAEPVRFGIPRSRVHELIGTPDLAHPGVDRWGAMREVNVGYDQQGVVYEIDLAPGNYELRLCGQIIWTASEHPDPNPMLLALDPGPLERAGFLLFTKIGVATAGYHDDDPGERVVQVHRKGAWDELLSKARQPGQDKYKPL